MTRFADIATAVAAAGLSVRGGFHPEGRDGVPPRADGRVVRAVILLGNVGASMWPAFEASAEFRDGLDHPLDRWTRRVGAALSARFGATALYPFDGPPHWPFQRWAQRAESVHASPLGLLIHPDHGLSHAYRVALLFREPVELPPRIERASPCDACTGKPCLTACPVGAFTGATYEVAACAAHLASSSGADCIALGCRARRACPIGDVGYAPAQSNFHMSAFLRAHAPPAGC